MSVRTSTAVPRVVRSHVGRSSNSVPSKVAAEVPVASISRRRFAQVALFCYPEVEQLGPASRQHHIGWLEVS